MGLIAGSHLLVAKEPHDPHHNLTRSSRHNEIDECVTGDEAQKKGQSVTRLLLRLTEFQRVTLRRKAIMSVRDRGEVTYTLQWYIQ